MKNLWDLVQQDFKERDAFGLRTYQRPLTKDSYENFLEEAYQEALDMVVYLKGGLEQYRYEHPTTKTTD